MSKPTIKIEISDEFCEDILKNNDKAYYLKIENNQVTEVLDYEELQNIIKNIVHKVKSKSAKESLTSNDDAPILYSLTRREQIDELNRRIEKTRDYLGSLLDRACSGIIKDGR